MNPIYARRKKDIGRSCSAFVEFFGPSANSVQLPYRRSRLACNTRNPIRPVMVANLSCDVGNFQTSEGNVANFLKHHNVPPIMPFNVRSNVRPALVSAGHILHEV